MESQQGERMQHLGLNFILNDEIYAAFYRNLVGRNVGNGYAVLSALTVGDEVVATLLGIRQGAGYVMVRISNAGEKWSNCSPGRLIIERTMAALHKDGIRQFDFSIGNYAYKRRFGVARIALVDFIAALSWRGLPYALRDHAARWMRGHPKLADRVKRALGKPPSREEK
jgi:CelD/BcsL family acetyltransferase involved in cellulose biosynthesis